MKQTILTIIALAVTMAAGAQSIREKTAKTVGTPISTDPQPVMTDDVDDSYYAAPRFQGRPIDVGDEDRHVADIAETDTAMLNLPPVNASGQPMPIGMYPYYWGGWYDWQLHPGLNVTLGASVMAQFGRGAMSGAGFSQNIAMMYAMPVNKYLSVAVGGYFNNMDWGRYSYRDAGINAMIGYKFNDRWEAYLYAQKSLTNNKRIPLPLYDISTSGDRIGAAVKYNFNPNFSIQVSFESDSRPVYRGFNDFPSLYRHPEDMR